MEASEEQFLKELEDKLEQNRRMAAKSWVPKPLYGVVSYLGFHSLRVLVLVSLGITVIIFAVWYPTMVELSRKVFLIL